MLGIVRSEEDKRFEDGGTEGQPEVFTLWRVGEKFIRIGGNLLKRLDPKK